MNFMIVKFIKTFKHTQNIIPLFLLLSFITLSKPVYADPCEHIGSATDPVICRIKSETSHSIFLEFKQPHYDDEVLHYEVIYDELGSVDPNGPVVFHALPSRPEILNRFAPGRMFLYNLAIISYLDSSSPNENLLAPSTYYCFHVNAVYEDGSRTSSDVACTSTQAHAPEPWVDSQGYPLPPNPLAEIDNDIVISDHYRLWVHDKYAEDVTSPIGFPLREAIGAIDPQTGVGQAVSQYIYDVFPDCAGEFIQGWASEVITGEAMDNLEELVKPCIRISVDTMFSTLSGRNGAFDDPQDRFLISCISNFLGQAFAESFAGVLNWRSRSENLRNIIIENAVVSCTKEGLSAAGTPNLIVDGDDYLQAFVTATVVDGLFAGFTTGSVYGALAGGTSKAIAFVLTEDLPTTAFMSPTDRYWYFLSDSIAEYQIFFPADEQEKALLLNTYNVLARAGICEECQTPSLTLSDAQALIQYMVSFPNDEMYDDFYLYTKLGSIINEFSFTHDPYYQDVYLWLDSLAYDDRYRLEFALGVAGGWDIGYTFPTKAAEYFSYQFFRITDGTINPQCTFSWRAPVGVYCGQDNILTAPSNINVTVVQSNSVQVEWEAPSLIDSNFTLELYENGSLLRSENVALPPFIARDPAPDFATPDSLRPENHIEPRSGEFRFENLSLGTMYCARVRANSDMLGLHSSFSPSTISGDDSMPDCAITFSLNEELHPPITPSLSAGNIPEREIDLHWYDPGGDRDAYEVRLFRKVNDTLHMVGGDNIINNANALTHSFSGLQENTEYCVQIRARFGLHASSWVPVQSNELCLTTAGGNTPPPPPSDVHLTALVDGDLSASWHDTSNDEHGYTARLLEMNEAGIIIASEVDLPANATRVTFRSPKLATNYCVQVLAFRNDAGASEYAPPSPVVFQNGARHCTTTPAFNTPPGSVSDVTLSLDQVNAIRVNWTANDDSANAFQVKLLREGELVTQGITPHFDHDIVFYDLDIDVEYCVQVRASNRWGYGEWTPASTTESCILTGSEISTPVSGVSISANSDRPYNSAIISWTSPSGETNGFRVELWQGNDLVEVHSPLTVTAGERSLTFNGLKNGKEYCARVANFTVSGGLSTFVPEANDQACITLENSGEIDIRFYAEYFNNIELDGTPIYTRYEDQIRHAWGTDTGPGNGVNDNFWSGRWSGSFTLDEADDYTAVLRSDDGSRLYIDGQLILDKWSSGGIEKYTTVHLSAGRHNVTIEYFQGPAHAELQFWLGKRFSRDCEHVNGTYCVDYFPNTQMIGAPVYSATDYNIDYSWVQLESPIPELHHDYFSILWTTNLHVTEPDTYVFQAQGNDGTRVWLNNSLILDNWNGNTNIGNARKLNNGEHKLEFGYFDYDHAGSVTANYYQNTAPDAPELTTPNNNSVVTNNVVLLRWSAPENYLDADGDVISYDVYLWPSGGVPELVATNITNNSYIALGLELKQQYEWYVVAKDNWGGSSTSDSWQFNYQYIHANFSSDTPLQGEAPFNVYLRSRSHANGNIVSYSWDINNDGITDYTSPNVSHTYHQAGTYTVSLTVSDGVNSDTHVEADYIRVEAPTVTPPPAPNAPTNVRITGVSHTNVAIQFDHQSSNETGVVIELYQDGAGAPIIYDVPAPITSYYGYDGLQPATRYCVRVRVYNDHDTSAWVPQAMNQTCATTLPEPEPIIVTIDFLSDSEVGLQWNDIPGGNNYSVGHYTPDGTRIEYLTYNLTTPEYRVTNLIAGEDYCFGVIGVYHGVQTPISNLACVETLMPPQNVRSTIIDGSALTFAWSEQSTYEGGLEVELYHNASRIQHHILPINTQSHRFGSLDPDSEYCVRVRTLGLGGGTSVWMPSEINAVCATTDKGTPTAPAGVEIGRVTTKTMVVNWQDMASNESGYRIALFKDGLFPPEIRSMPANAQSIDFTSLEPNTRYCARVQSYNSLGGSEWVPRSETEVCGKTVGIPIEFNDWVLEQAVREIIKRPFGPIYPKDVSELTTLRVSSSSQFPRIKVQDISALVHFVNLTLLDLGGNNISDLSPLSGLTKLTELYLQENPITSIAALANLTQLRRLNISKGNLIFIPELSSLVNLEFLDLSENNIQSILGFESLTKLQQVHLHLNPIDSIMPLVNNSGMGSGDFVTVSFNPFVHRFHRSRLSPEKEVKLLREKGVTVWVYEFPRDSNLR